MSERERATGECECGAIIYGPGIYCDGCRISLRKCFQCNNPDDCVYEQEDPPCVGRVGVNEERER